MAWTKWTIQTVSEAVELLCAVLTEAGFAELQITDSRDFQAFLETSGDYWDYVDRSLEQAMANRSQVGVYLDGEQSADALRAVLAALPSDYPACDFGSLRLSCETVPEEDWETSWQSNYRPLPVGTRFLVVPQWQRETPLRGRLPLYLNLGMSFGTGEHETTQLCLCEMERLLHGGESVADLGSGSGILSIAALRLGAKTAVGVDVDPAAEHMARENAALNGFGADRFTALTGNVVEDTALLRQLGGGSFDLVCANIVAGVLVRLAPAAQRLLRKNGYFLCSGILDGREQEVREALERAGLKIIGATQAGQWCCLLSVQKEA